jgi:hypothetical protein
MGDLNVISIDHVSCRAPAFAQLSSRFASGAPAAPMEPMTSSPSLITTPPPKHITCGSLARGAIESSPFLRSANARVSFLNDTLVCLVARTIERVNAGAFTPQRRNSGTVGVKHELRCNPVGSRRRPSRSQLRPLARQECDAWAMYPPDMSMHR